VGGGGEGGVEAAPAGSEKISVGLGKFHQCSFRRGCRLGEKTQREAAR
jgi:hypothetical protein